MTTPNHWPLVRGVEGENKGNRKEKKNYVNGDQVPHAV
jgi:hypothetical protein